MRKLLLASVFSIGAAGLIGSAMAAEGQNPMQGQMVAKPGGTPGANTNNNAYGTARKGSMANPTPGTLVIHLNARVQVAYYHGWDSLQTVNANRRSSGSMTAWLRLYGGADGMAANGMRYGAGFEVRTNSGGGASVTTPSTANPGSNASGSTTTNTLYVRRAFVYAGHDKFGIIRAGTGDDLNSLYDGGRTTLQTFSPNSHFNGSDLSTAGIGGNSNPAFVFGSGSGNAYDTKKFVYMSPNFSGFDFGAQYVVGAFQSLNGCGVVASSCAQLSTSTTAADGARFKDLIGFGGRYTGKVGPIDVLAYGVYHYGSHVSTATGATPITRAAASTWDGLSFDNLNFGNVGVALTYQGFTLGLNYVGGAVNGQWAARPTGGKTMNALLVGAQYKIPGTALTVGTAFATIESQGAVGLTSVSSRKEYEFDIGGSYRIAPGLVLYADYMYQNRKQTGWNFATASLGAANNQVQGQGFVLGTQMTW